MLVAICGGGFPFLHRFAFQICEGRFALVIGVEVVARMEESVVEVFARAHEVFVLLKWAVLTNERPVEDEGYTFRHKTLLQVAPASGAAGKARSDDLRTIRLETSLDFNLESSDVVMIDEAAGQPTALLERFLESISHSGRKLSTILAGTVHGYEGTGHGLLRALERAEAKGMKLRRLKLETPVRWPLDDPVEQLVANALLLDTEPSPLPTTVLDELEVERIRRQDLVSSEEVIREVYGLLSIAHYRTRPADLRLLLDETRLELFAILAGGCGGRRLLACALLLHEQCGGLRRHDLLAEALAPTADLGNAGNNPSFLRIARVAVHPQVQGKGLGRKLLHGILDTLATRGDGRADLIGAVFASNPRLLNFWSSTGFLQVPLSKRTGLEASNCLVIRPVSAVGRLFWECRASAREAKCTNSKGLHSLLYVFLFFG